MKLSTKLLVLFSALYSQSSSQTDDEKIIKTEGAIAHFSDTGIDGNVKVMHGNIIFNLTFASNFDWAPLGGADTCLSGGLHFGIYHQWEFSDYGDKLGPDACGPDNTGYRWDPWLACSTSSSNENCISNDGCVPPYSEKWNADEYEYICNQWTYQKDPYICELGDWSGKYGLLEVEEKSGEYQIFTTYSSAFEVDSYDLGGRSLMFRCHDNTRAFCSGFEEYNPTDEELEEIERPFQETFYNAADYENDDPTDNIYSMIAEFGSSGNSYVLLTYYNTYEIVLDSSDLDVPGGCGNEIYYRIFTEWDETGGDCEEKTSDRFWDPTIVCADNSENGDTNGKQYCEEDYYLCRDRNWVYSCLDYYDEENLNSRITCAPGDLSAKYGSINIKDNVNFRFEMNGTDPKLPPMAKLRGKSLVLQCSSDKAILDCAGFQEYYDDIGKTTIESSDSSDDNKKKKNKNNDDSFMGMSGTVAIIMVVLGLAAIVPCVRSCRNRRAGSATGVDDDFYDGKKKNKDDNGDELYTGGNIRQASTSRTMTGNGEDHYKGRTVPSMQQAIPM